jgi:glutamate 5-kinase
MKKKEIIVIKVGTSVITKTDGSLDTKSIKHITEEIASLRKRGFFVVLISSGAVGAGKGLTKITNDDEVIARQVYASVGQLPLIQAYQTAFGKNGYTLGQVLVTKSDFRDRHHYLNMKRCFTGLLEEGIIPIVNENDVVSVTELMFTDNDELAGLVATMIDAKKVFLLTSEDGLYNRNPEDENAKIISEVKEGSSEWKFGISSATSQFGRGGMATKCGVAEKLQVLGTTTYICNGRTKNIVQNILDGKSLGTTFPGTKKKTANIKKRLAHATGQEKGKVFLNDCATDLFRDKEKTLSVLPVGITKIEGEFEKGDIVTLVGIDKKTLGVGIAQYSNEVAKKYIGKKGKRPIIHYNYLYLGSI